MAGRKCGRFSAAGVEGRAKEGVQKETSGLLLFLLKTPDSGKVNLWLCPTDVGRIAGGKRLVKTKEELKMQRKIVTGYYTKTLGSL